MSVASSKITQKVSCGLRAFLGCKGKDRGYETTFCLTMAQGKNDPGENYQHKSIGTEEDSDRTLHPHMGSHSVVYEHRERERSLVSVSFLIRTLILLGWGPTLMTSFNVI